MMPRLILLLLIVANMALVRTKDPWRSFVASPTEENFDACKKQISSSMLSKVEMDKTVTFEQVVETEGRFLTLVKNGNKYAAELCFQLYPVFSGYPADLESFDQALGSFLKHDPRKFLQLLGKYRKLFGDAIVSPRIVGNLGAELIDKTDKQIDEANERMGALEAVRDTTYSYLQKECLQVLKELIRQLR